MTDTEFAAVSAVFRRLAEDAFNPADHIGIGTDALLNAQGGSLDERGVDVTWVRCVNVDVPQFSPKKPAA